MGLDNARGIGGAMMGGLLIHQETSTETWRMTACERRNALKMLKHFTTLVVRVDDTRMSVRKSNLIYSHLSGRQDALIITAHMYKRRLYITAQEVGSYYDPSLARRIVDVWKRYFPLCAAVAVSARRMRCGNALRVTTSETRRGFVLDVVLD